MSDELIMTLAPEMARTARTLDQLHAHEIPDASAPGHNHNTLYVRQDGTTSLTGTWDIGDGQKIQADRIEARDGDGLLLYDDSNNGLRVDINVYVDDPDAGANDDYYLTQGNDGTGWLLSHDGSDFTGIHIDQMSAIPKIDFYLNSAVQASLSQDAGNNDFVLNDGGIKLGSTTRANDGTLRWNGANLQLYDSGAYRTVWHQNNDGAASGLDADLLDSLDSSAFFILAGQSGGQVGYGGIGSGDDLELWSTSHATPGTILLEKTGAGNVAVGLTSTTYKMQVRSDSASKQSFVVSAAASHTASVMEVQDFSALPLFRVYTEDGSNIVFEVSGRGDQGGATFVNGTTGTTRTTLEARGVASQTGPILSLSNSGAAVLWAFYQSDAGAELYTRSATRKGITITGHTSQSANLFEVQNVSAVDKFYIDGSYDVYVKTNIYLANGDSTTTLQIDNTATDGDPVLGFALSGTRQFTIGVDDGDLDKLKIGTTAIGTSTRLTLDGSGFIGIGTDAPDELLEIENGNSTTVLQISNSAADGDPVLAFALTGVKTFTMGIDDGDGDKFKIGTTAIGTNTILEINSSGNVTINGNTLVQDTGAGSIVDALAVENTSNATNSGVNINLGLAGDIYAAIQMEKEDASTSGTLRLMTQDSGGSVSAVMELFGNGGVVVGSPTGGNKGLGTINAKAVYDDDTLLTGADFVFESDYNMMTIAAMSAFVANHKHLPTIDGRAVWETKGKPSLGHLVNQIYETVEVQALYIMELHERIRELEDGIISAS